MSAVDTLLSVVMIGGALFVVGPAVMSVVKNMGAQAAPLPGTPTTTTPASTGNPIQDLINQLTTALQGQTGTTPGQVYVDPTTGQVVTIPAPTTTSGANPSLCHSKYFGKCDTECKNGNNSTCQACKIACGLTSNFATAYSAVFDRSSMPPPIGHKITIS